MQEEILEAAQVTAPAFLRLIEKRGFPINCTSDCSLTTEQHLDLHLS